MKTILIAALVAFAIAPVGAMAQETAAMPAAAHHEIADQVRTDCTAGVAVNLTKHVAICADEAPAYATQGYGPYFFTER